MIKIEFLCKVFHKYLNELHNDHLVLILLFYNHVHCCKGLNFTKLTQVKKVNVERLYSPNEHNIAQVIEEHSDAQES